MHSRYDTVVVILVTVSKYQVQLYNCTAWKLLFSLALRFCRCLCLLKNKTDDFDGDRFFPISKFSNLMTVAVEQHSKMNRKEERRRLDLRLIVQEKAPTNILKIAPTP